MAMETFVTGGTGFIGRRVVGNLVRDGHAVRLFSRGGVVPPELASPGITAVTGTLEEPETLDGGLEGVDVVYHIGEIGNTTRKAAGKNVAAVRHLLGAMKRLAVRRLVFISSISVAGIPARVPAREDTEALVDLNDHYTAYKREAEAMIREEAEGLEFVILRPAMVYGQGSRVLPRVLSLLRTLGPVGIPFVGNGHNLLPLIHVQDLGRAVYRAGVEEKAAGATLNVSDGMKHRWRDVFDEIGAVWGKTIRLLPVPALLLRIPALGLDFAAWPFGIDSDPAAYLEYFSRDICFDNARARKKLDWAPEYDLKRGIAEMLGREGPSAPVPPPPE